MEKQQLISYFFIALFCFILYQIVLIFSPFFNAIFLAGILAFAFHPLYNKIRLSLKLKKSAASLMTTILVLLIVILPAGAVLANSLNEAAEFYQKVSALIRQGTIEQLIERARLFLSQEWAQQIRVAPPALKANVTELLLKGARAIGNFSAMQLSSFTKNVFLWAVNFSLIPVLLFFFLKDGRLLHDFLFQLAPLSKLNKVLVSQKINETLAAVIRGQLVTSLVQAALTGFTFWFLALPLPIFFGFVTFLTSLVPVTGAATVWVPFVIYLFAVNETRKAVTLLLIGIFVISLSDNLLKPVLIGKKTKLPLLLLFLGIFGGLNLYGFIGLFAGPVVLSLFFVLLEIYQKEFQAEN